MVMKMMTIEMVLLDDAADLTTILLGFNTCLYNTRHTYRCIFTYMYT